MTYERSTARSWQGSFLALFFAACFLTLHFNVVAETHFERSDNQHFQIQIVSDSLTDSSFDNSAIYKQADNTQPVYRAQVLSKPEQKQKNFENNGPLSKHPFLHFMQHNLAAICQNYQHQLTIAFSNQQLLESSFESNPLLTAIDRHLPPEEPDQLPS